MKKQDIQGTKPVQEMTLEELRAEKERLEITHLRLTVGREQAHYDARVRAVEAQQKSLEDANAQIIAEQKICRHKKGGKDLPGLLAGDGIKGGYSVLQHTYGNGDIGIHCTRCAKAWFKPGSRMQKASDPRAYAAQRGNKAEYERQLAEYLTAESWPSDNSSSGTQTHLLQQSVQRSA